MATDVAVASDMEVEAISSDNGGAKKDNASAVDQTEVRRKSVTPQLASPMLNPLADIDLAEFSLLEVLTQAATDVLGSIPAQRCIVYVYDKAANLLRPQVVVDCNDTDTTDPDVKPNEVSTPIEPINEAPHQPADEVTTTTSMAERMSYNVTKSPLVSFPPVVGMVSSSFLQRRCLRMQEPNPHRTFHREYDVPKDMQVDSILCAPVILYRRATGVIQVVTNTLTQRQPAYSQMMFLLEQLINHVDVTAERSLFEETERAATPQDLRNESSSEVRLRRLKTIKAMMNTGFSAKDEQKLLHFTTHVAQTIEMNTKKLADGRSHAKLREVNAKQALDLLKALNGQIVARVSRTEMLMPTDITDHTGRRSVFIRRATITRMPSQTGELTDMLSALVVIMRLQAMFRGRRQRRADKFAEELEKFRKQRERLRTMVVMQRIVRPPEEPKPKPYEKPEVSASSRSPRMRPEGPKKPPKSPTKMPTTTSSPRPPPSRPQRPPPEPTRIQRRKVSATKIQTVFRRHRQRRQFPTPLPGQPVVHHELSKEVSGAVKVQSFIRGNLTRKRLRRALRSSQGAHIICLRVASSSTEAAASNQTSHDSAPSTQLRSRACVYAMPERPGKVPLVQRRSSSPRFSQEERFDVHQSQEVSIPESRGQNVAVQSRRLVAIHKTDDTFRLVKSPVSRSKPRWSRFVSSVVWETSQLELAPPGVEFVQHRRPIGRESEKASSPRAATMANVPEPNKVVGLDNPSVRLPTLGLQTRRDVQKSSLLCCLLPAQAKTGGIASIPARPLAQMRRKAFEAKRRHTPAAGDAAA